MQSKCLLTCSPVIGKEVLNLWDYKAFPPIERRCGTKHVASQENGVHKLTPRVLEEFNEAQINLEMVVLTKHIFIRPMLIWARI